MKIKANFVDDKKEIDESNIVNVGQKNIQGWCSS